MSFLSEFKAFAMRGNVMDLAVAVIIGAAFNKIVTALVEGVIMPVIGLLLGGINITEKSFTIGHTVVKWGLFLQSIIDFTIIAFVIFLMIKLLNQLKAKEPEKTPEIPEEVKLLRDIRDLLQENKRQG